MGQLVLRTSVIPGLIYRTLTSKANLIYILDKTGKITDTKTKAQAEILAKKKNCILIKKDEAHLKYQAYMMIDPKRDLNVIEDDENKNTKDKQKEDLKPKEIQVEEVKTDKQGKKKGKELRKIHLGTSISHHDLLIKIKQIKKFLISNNDVQISFYEANASPKKFEKLYEEFAKEVQGFKIVQKIINDTHLKFTILGTKGDGTTDEMEKSKNVDEEELLKEILKNDDDLDKIVQAQLRQQDKSKIK